MKSDVYFIETKSNDLQARCTALQKLLNKAEPFSIYKKEEFVPVKITVGDSPCIYHTNPGLVKLVISQIKKKKAKPFLFDTNVIYKGKRLNAVDHLTLVQNKGFGYAKTGAPFIIGDGLFGQDGNEFEIDSSVIKKIRIPSFIGLLDSLLVLSHITGHILAGYAGAIKNVAMGMSSKATKQVQHSSVRPHVIPNKCTSCGCCIEICPVEAISIKNKKAHIAQNRCIGCGECLCACKFDAISVNWDEDNYIFCQRMVDVAIFMLSKFKNRFFINFAFDITKECDCISTKNEEIIYENTGILASSDIVSIDKATLDMTTKGKDPYLTQNSQATYKKMLEYAHDKKLGTLEYNLVKI